MLSEKNNELNQTRTRSLFARFLLGALRTFVLTPLMFFNLILILFVTVLFAAKLRQVGVVSQLDTSYLLNFIMENFGQRYQLAEIIKFMLWGSFFLSILNSVFHYFRGVKREIGLQPIIYTSALIVVVWIIIFFMMGGFSIPNLAEGVIVFYIFGGIHLFLNFVHGFTNYLLANNA